MRDWILEMGLVSHWFPSMGDPRQMPIDTFDGLIGTWHKVAALSGGRASQDDVLQWSAGL